MGCSGGSTFERDAPGAALGTVCHAAHEGGVDDDIVGAHKGEGGALAVSLFEKLAGAGVARLGDGCGLT